MGSGPLAELPEVQKTLRKTLKKYQLHTDQELFNRAYDYIKQYY